MFVGPYNASSWNVKRTRYASPILRVKDIATASFCATGAAILLGSIAVIVVQFLPCCDIASGDNPDRALGNVDLTVRIAGMIDVASPILERLPIDIVAVIEGKNVGIAPSQALEAFVFGNLRTDILELFLNKRETSSKVQHRYQ